MKITVVGAGAIGSAVAYDLHLRNEVAQVQVCDTTARSLQELHDRVDSPKLRSFQVDARDPSVLRTILVGSDGVVSCLPSEMNLVLAELCLDLGIHYCDMGGSDTLVHKQLSLAEEARRKAVWIIPNCGLAPGLVNVLCMHGIEQFDDVDAAYLRVGDVPLNPEPPFNFAITWSAEKVIDDYMNPVQVVNEGVIHEEAPLTNDERIAFPEPFGSMEAFYTRGGLSTLAESLAGRIRRLTHKTIRWPGHAEQMRFLLALGFGENRKIDVRTHLTYRDLLARKLRQRLGGEQPDAVLLRALVKGIKDGRRQSLVYEMVERYDPEFGLTAVKRCTSIPAASVIVFAASGRLAGGGAAPPEDVLPKDAYLEMIHERGLRITTTWYEGYVDVTDPEAGEADED